MSDKARKITEKKGPVTAYADAVAQGFTGTREEFGKWQADAAKNAQAVAENLAESQKVLQQVNEAGAAQVKAVEAAGAGQVEAVEAAGAGEVSDVEAAGDRKIQEIGGTGAVIYGAAQELTEGEKQQARENAGAASQSDLLKTDEKFGGLRFLVNQETGIVTVCKDITEK